MNKSKEHQRFKDAVASLDRYGVPRENIVSMVEAMSDLIDSEAHGRNDFGECIEIVQDGLDCLRRDYMQRGGNPKPKAKP